MTNKGPNNNSAAMVNIDSVRAKYENLMKVENSIDSLEDYIAFQLFMNRFILNKLTDKYIPHEKSAHEQASKFLLEIVDASVEAVGEYFDIKKI